jgi:CBS domain-containing protein
MSTHPQRVSDIMTREVVTVFEEENLTGLMEGMERYGVRHLPVVDGKRLVGLVTHRDMLRVAASTLLGNRASVDDTLEKQHFVSAIMRRDVATASPDMKLADAARTMREQKIGCLPVVDADGSLVGIVTATDFLRLAEQLLA